MTFDWRRLLWRWLRPSEASAPAEANAVCLDGAVYFHEDDYCQTQLLPLTAWDHCAQQLREIGRFADAQHAGSSGYTDIYLRKDGPIALGDLRLRFLDVDRLLATHLSCHRLVTTGYGSAGGPVPRVVGYGAGQSGCLFVHHDEAGLVIEMFAQFLSMQPQEIAAMHAALAELTGTVELLLVDWPHGALFALADSDALRKYLSLAQLNDPHSNTAGIG